MPSAPRDRSLLEFPALFPSSEAIFRCFVNRVELEAVVIEAWRFPGKRLNSREDFLV